MEITRGLVIRGSKPKVWSLKFPVLSLKFNIKTGTPNSKTYSDHD